MQKYIKNYMQFFGYTDFVPSEISGSQAVDIHHIIKKSQGGTDDITNLIALTRQEHEQAHFLRKPYLTKEQLQNIHNDFICNKF